MLTFVRLTGPNKGEKLQFDGALIRLGRARGNDVRFDRERERVVGNNHAEIRLEDGGFVLYDLQSTHGTYVNDQRVTRWRLQEGDVVGLAQQMGGPTLRFSRRSEDSTMPLSAGREASSTMAGPDAMDTGARPWNGEQVGNGPSGASAPGSIAAGRSAAPIERPTPHPRVGPDPIPRETARAILNAPANDAQAQSYSEPGPFIDGEAEHTRPLPGSWAAGPREADTWGGPQGGAMPASPAPVARGSAPSTRLLDSTESAQAFQRNAGAPTRELPLAGFDHAYPSSPQDDTVETGRSRGSAQSTSLYLEVPSLPPNLSRDGAWQPGSGPGGRPTTGPGWQGLVQQGVSQLSGLGRIAKTRFDALAGGAGVAGLRSRLEALRQSRQRSGPNPRGSSSSGGQGAGGPTEQFGVAGRGADSRTGSPSRQSREFGAGLEPAGSQEAESPAWAAGASRPKVQDFRRQRAAREVLSPPMPQVSEDEEGQPLYPRQFVLEEAIKEKERPEWIWVRRHRLLLLTMFVTAVMAWLYADQGAVWLAATRVGPVPMIESRSMEEPLVDPPGAKNPELVKLVAELDERVRSVPPQRMDSGDATLRSLRSIVRAAGEDSEFIPIDFSKQVDQEIKVLKKQRGFEFTYQRSLKQRPIVEKMLETARLPAFLSFIPWVESDYSATFTDNREGRVGLWGLTVDTARRHGLVVSRERDERRDWKLETEAAISYLIELVGETRGQSFALAAAAFHRGPKAARSMLTERRTWKPEEINFWQFFREQYVPPELIHFLARVMGAAVIAQNPERFGLPPAGEP